MLDLRKAAVPVHALCMRACVRCAGRGLTQYYCLVAGAENEHDENPLLDLSLQFPRAPFENTIAQAYTYCKLDLPTYPVWTAQEESSAETRSKSLQICPLSWMEAGAKIEGHGSLFEPPLILPILPRLEVSTTILGENLGGGGSPGPEPKAYEFGLWGLRAGLTSFS